MEKDPFFGGGDHHQLATSFLNLSWDHHHHHQPVESALSSLVSSPSAATDSVVVRELIDRLGTICNSAEISPAASRYAAPLHSPPKHSPPALGPVRLSRAPSSHSLSESGGRKRKAAATKGKGKEAALRPPPPPKEEEDSSAKRCKSAAAETKEDSGNAKASEPPKQDYIHVRARRGQATDSHSLAERVRREKISERMKFLQDLVPGCNKVTGKAVMLDEIINYVQSLQRQVEFLSMKLSTVINPGLDFNVDSLFAKDMHQLRGPVAPNPEFSMESASSAGFRYGDQPQVPPLQSLLANGTQLPNLDAFMDASSHLGAFWEDDLQSVVQMGFGQNQEAVFSSQAFQGSLPTTHMKIEL